MVIEALDECLSVRGNPQQAQDDSRRQETACAGKDAFSGKSVGTVCNIFLAIRIT